MRMIRALAIAAAFVAAAAPALAAWSIADLNRTIDQSNFIVNDGCSGTLISIPERLILTNYHCIDNLVRVVEKDRTGPDGEASKVKITIYDLVTVKQNSYNAQREVVGQSAYVTEIVAVDKDTDLAFLRFRQETIPNSYASPLLPPGAVPIRGESVWIVGNPRGLDATVVTGIVSSTTRAFKLVVTDEKPREFLQISGGVTFGNSGGALYNDRGQLIGVPSLTVTQANFIGLAVPSMTVWRVLADHCMAAELGGSDNPELCKDGEPIVERHDDTASATGGLPASP